MPMRKYHFNGPMDVPRFLILLIALIVIAFAGSAILTVVAVVALVAAAFEEVDSTPMEGFDADALDALLNLRARGLRSVAIMPLGYRDAANDWLVALKKVRRPNEEFISWVE